MVCPKDIPTAIKEVWVMEKRNITDYTDFYATFVRIKDNEPRRDYIVLPDGKDKGESDGKDRKQYN